MENNQKPTAPETTGISQQSAVQQSKAMDNVAADSTKEFKLSIQCAIRRKPTTVGLPGTDPNDRNYKIGSSIDNTTKKNLKGIDDELERKFMPAILGMNLTDNTFQAAVDEYWGNIGVYVPAEDPFMKEEERGKVLKINYTVKGENRKNKIDGEPNIETKINMIKKCIIDGTVTLDYASVADFILLCYCLRYSRVAKEISHLDRSPKILFYIYNKSSAVKTRLNTIELRSKAIEYFNLVKDDEVKVNALLVMFDDLPTMYDDLDDKVIALDRYYNKNIESMERFVNWAKDTDLNLKYLVRYATQKGKLMSPSNTDAYYYNQVLLGKNLNETVLYLKDETNAEAQAIRRTLEKEIKD